MSEFEHDLAPSDDPDWVGLILDVESRFETLNESLADLRSAVIRLSAHHPPVQVIEVSAAVEPDPIEAAVVAEAHSEAADGAVADVASQEAPAPAAAAPAESPVMEGPAAEAPPVEDEEARRAEVSRIVAEARQGLSTPPPASRFDGSWAAPHDDSEVDSTSEGSWPIASPREAPSPAAHRPLAKDPAAEAAPEPNAPDQDDESRRDGVAGMVAEMRAGPDSGAEEKAEATTAVVEEEPRRGVARMVAEMRAQMASSEPAEVEEPATEQDESRREEVVEVVARTFSEMAPGKSADGEDTGAPSEGDEAVDEVDVRDEVRRAVETARAEMASGWVKADASEASGAADSDDKKFSFPDWQNARMEPSGPPVIVIKDSEGRVELARVYETLSQVNCDENAALLNYTPHSVTVGLNIRAAVPTKEALESAVEVVFGRKCHVESDGVRLSVDIGRDFDKEDVA